LTFELGAGVLTAIGDIQYYSIKRCIVCLHIDDIGHHDDEEDDDDINRFLQPLRMQILMSALGFVPDEVLVYILQACFQWRASGHTWRRHPHKHEGWMPE